MVDSKTNTLTITSKTIWLAPADNIAEENKQTVSEQKPKIKKSVRFSEDTVDNESLNRLKSNLCCIYHKPKQEIGESSSSTCSSDDSGNELERSRETKKKHKEKCSKHKKKHDCCSHDKKNESNQQQQN